MAELLIKESKLINEKIDFSTLKNQSILITGASGIMGIFFILSLKNVYKHHNIKITAWLNRDVPDYLYKVFDDIDIIKRMVTFLYNVS